MLNKIKSLPPIEFACSSLGVLANGVATGYVCCQALENRRVLAVSLFYIPARVGLFRPRSGAAVSLIVTGAMERAYHSYMATTRGLNA